MVEVRSYPNPATGYHRHAFCVERYVEESKIDLTEGQGLAWIAFSDLPSLDMTEYSRSANWEAYGTLIDRKPTA